jgi:hypothetical protein
LGANINIYGRLYISADSSCRQIPNRKEEEDALYLPLGFELNPDREEYGKKVSLEDCSEVYEIRKDYILPKGFIPGETKELRGGYTVLEDGFDEFDHNYKVISKKTIYKDGIKVAEFTKDLW